jgi:hypothetical protein
MKRPAVLIVSLVAGALLVAGAGASAHTLSLVRSIGTHNPITSDDRASGARTESPEPEDSPEATPTAEPTRTPRPTETPEPAENENEPAENENEPAENENEDGNHDGGTGSGDHHDVAAEATTS